MPRSEEQNFKEKIKKTRALTIGHIIFSSGGKHGSGMLDEDALYPDPVEISLLCEGIAERFRYDGVNTVISLSVGGNAILSHEVARHLCEMCERRVFSIYANDEKTPSGLGSIFSHKHNEELSIKINHRIYITGKKVLVVGDFLTTGKHAKKLIEVVQNLGGTVVGIGVLCNCADVLPRNIAKVPKLVALTSVKLNVWNKENCPMCNKNQ